MDRILTLDDLERRIYGESSRSSTTARQTGLRRVLNFLYGSTGAAQGRRYEGSDPAEFETVVTQIQTLRSSLCERYGTRHVREDPSR